MEVSIHNISKKFKSQVVLDQIDLTLENGKIHCLLGASGAGKTTLLRIITGALKSDLGKVTLGGTLIPNRKLMNKVGFMPQEDGLYHELSIYDNLKFFAGIQKIKGAAFKKRAKHLLDITDLSKDKNKLVANCSGGMKKRVSLAVSMIHDPELLILDEPTVGLDPVIRYQIWQYLQDLKSHGKTIIVTTHVMDEIKNCDDATLLRGGKILMKDRLPTWLPRHLMGMSNVYSLMEVTKNDNHYCPYTQAN